MEPTNRSHPIVVFGSQSNRKAHVWNMVPGRGFRISSPCGYCSRKNARMLMHISRCWIAMPVGLCRLRKSTRRWRLLGKRASTPGNSTCCSNSTVGTARSMTTARWSGGVWLMCSSTPLWTILTKVELRIVHVDTCRRWDLYILMRMIS